MPGWGTGSFDNEDAQEWLKRLATVRVDQITEVLARAASNPTYLEAHDSSIAIAAAEVIATVNGLPAPQVPPAIRGWMDQNPIDSAPELTALALEAVRRVASNSELKDLWLEADGLREWQAAVRELEQRLAK